VTGIQQRRPARRTAQAQHSIVLHSKAWHGIARLSRLPLSLPTHSADRHTSEGDGWHQRAACLRRHQRACRARRPADRRSTSDTRGKTERVHMEGPQTHLQHEADLASHGLGEALPVDGDGPCSLHVLRHPPSYCREQRRLPRPARALHHSGSGRKSSCPSQHSRELGASTQRARLSACMCEAGRQPQPPGGVSS
jgi:hypothetical protein